MSQSVAEVRKEYDQHVGLCLGVAAVPLVPLVWLLRSDGDADTVMSVLAIPVGVFFAWGALKYLRETWPVAALPPDPLAIAWSVDDATWWRFWATEARNTPRPTLVKVWPAILVVWLAGGFCFGVVASAAVVAARVLWYVRGALAVGRTVELRGDTLYVGGLPHVVRGGGQLLLHATIDRERDPAALALEVSVPGGAGLSETVRAPVPADRLMDAELLVAWLESPP